jgi:hypothetical protein
LFFLVFFLCLFAKKFKKAVDSSSKRDYTVYS